TRSSCLCRPPPGVTRVLWDRPIVGWQGHSRPSQHQPRYNRNRLRRAPLRPLLLVLPTRTLPRSARLARLARLRRPVRALQLVGTAVSAPRPILGHARAFCAVGGPPSPPHS